MSATGSLDPVRRAASVSRAQPEERSGAGTNHSACRASSEARSSKKPRPPRWRHGDLLAPSRRATSRRPTPAPPPRTGTSSMGRIEAELRLVRQTASGLARAHLFARNPSTSPGTRGKAGRVICNNWASSPVSRRPGREHPRCVHDWLSVSRHAGRIAAVRNAHPRHGGGGSLYVILRRR